MLESRSTHIRTKVLTDKTRKRPTSNTSWFRWESRPHIEAVASSKHMLGRRAGQSGRTFKQILYKTMSSTNCSIDNEWRSAVDISCIMRNRLLLKGGYSSIQRVLGFTLRLPGELMAGREPRLNRSTPIAPGDLTIHRSMGLRKAAAKAFFEADCQQAIQEALYAGPPISDDDIVPLALSSSSCCASSRPPNFVPTSAGQRNTLATMRGMERRASRFLLCTSSVRRSACA